MPEQSDAIRAADTERENSIVAIGAAGLNDHGGLFSWTWSFSLPNTECKDYAGVFHGQSFTFDWCPAAAKVRDIGGYVLYILTVWTIFGILVGKKEA